VQTMLTVVTQNSRLLRRSALSGDRMVFGFGYPHCSMPDQCLLATDYETIREVKRRVAPLLGFCGAPWTVPKSVRSAALSWPSTRGTRRVRCAARR
jgi:hypothetical protein